MRILFKLKYAGLLFVTAAFVALSGSAAFGATTANDNVVVTVAAAASISTPGSTTLTLSGAPFTSPYTGNTVLTFSIRTTPGTGSGAITVKGTTDFTPGTPLDVGPTIAAGNLTYTCPLAGLTGGGSLTGALSYCNTASGATPQTVSMVSSTNVLTGMGAKSKATSATFTVDWSVPDSATYDVDTYTATVQFTITAN